MKTTPEAREWLRRNYPYPKVVGELLDEIEALESELAAFHRVESEGLCVEREFGAGEPMCWYVADGDYGGRANTLVEALVKLDNDKGSNRG